MDGTIVVVSEVVDWSLVEAETVPIEEGTNVDVPTIINNAGGEHEINNLSEYLR